MEITDKLLDEIENGFTKESWGIFTGTPEDDLISFHHSFGRYLRNTYNLWYEDLDGVHPDDFSFEIIQKLWKRNR